MNTLLWLQRDLRVSDNLALNWALQQGKPIIAIYIHSPQEDAPWAAGAASRWWLQESLKKLSVDLLKLNIKLQFFKDDSVSKISQLVKEYPIDSVVWTNRHEPKRIQCEEKIETELSNSGIFVKRCKDELLTQPDAFLTASKHTPYKVFTPFYKKLRRELNLSDFYKTNNAHFKTSELPAHLPENSLNLEQLKLVDDHNWHEKLHNYWSPGEQSAIDKLDSFIDETLVCYRMQRDIPAIDATSGLSAHLHFGEISAQQIVTALVPLIEIQGGKFGEAAEGFLRQLIWREFARYILWHFPETCTDSMNEKFTTSFWKSDSKNLKKWQQGETGIPIIDAGMKQLWETGTMHNRVRMLVASLLTKNMGIAWQQGARWFWNTLVDADLANNSMGWQWVAGCGVDAAPYFRIFNPNTQAQKFDKQGSYINRWVKSTPSLLQKKPIVDLSISRAKALDRYKHIIRKFNSS